jgi:hypothetical protein
MERRLNEIERKIDRILNELERSDARDADRGDATEEGGEEEAEAPVYDDLTLDEAGFESY